MKKTKKVILKGNAEAIKKYNKQKFVDKGLESLGSIIGIIILVLIINSFKSFKEYWADKEDLKKLLKQEDKYLTIEKIKKNVCKDFAKDAISKGDGNKECDAIAILRKKIDDNIFGFMLDNDYKKDSVQISKKNNVKKNLLDKKNNTKAKVSTAKKETKPSGCLEGDCVNGFSKIQYSNGYYIGEFKNKKEDGQGTYVWNSGDKYIGEWKHGNMTGQGTYTWTSGNKYIGEWKDGNRTGQGTFIWKDGNKYFGEFYKNKMNGEGTYISGEDNTMMIGEFVSNEINDGVIIFPDGFKLGVFKKNGKIEYTRVQNTNQNMDLLAKQLKRNNNLQTSRMLLDISKSLMGSKKNRTPLNLNNLNIGGGFLSGSSSSGIFKKQIK